MIAGDETRIEEDTIADLFIKIADRVSERG